VLALGLLPMQGQTSNSYLKALEMGRELGQVRKKFG
tara:strand:+ start:414 stop:521 length:108 start_codon:yes stop_codon:yes gene_type:complete